MRKWKHKLEYFQDRTGAWRWRFKSRNGKILCHSEAYSSITMARKGATGLLDSVKAKTLACEVL